MSVALIMCFLYYLLVTAECKDVVDAFPAHEYRCEIFNTLPDNVRATCYNMWSKTLTSVVEGGGNYNITFHQPWAWCCDFVWYNKDPRGFFQSFVASDVRGYISDDPQIRCGERCTWRIDFKGFSVFYNGAYHRLYKWIIFGIASGTGDDDLRTHDATTSMAGPTGVFYDLTCSVAKRYSIMASLGQDEGD